MASVDRSGTTGKVRLVPGIIITREYWDRMKTRPRLTGTGHATIHGFSTWLDREDNASTGGHFKAREAAERKAAKPALKDGRPGLTLNDTRQVTVVVEADGEVITAFPGFPDYPPGLLRRPGT